MPVRRKVTSGPCLIFPLNLSSPFFYGVRKQPEPTPLAINLLQRLVETVRCWTLQPPVDIPVTLLHHFVMGSRENSTTCAFVFVDPTHDAIHNRTSTPPDSETYRGAFVVHDATNLWTKAGEAIGMDDRNILPLFAEEQILLPLDFPETANGLYTCR